MEIDCGRCQMRGAGCQDCVVTVLEPRNVASFSTEEPGFLPEAEVKALGVLAAAGMVDVWETAARYQLVHAVALLGFAGWLRGAGGPAGPRAAWA